MVLSLSTKSFVIPAPPGSTAFDWLGISLTNILFTKPELCCTTSLLKQKRIPESFGRTRKKFQMIRLRFHRKIHFIWSLYVQWHSAGLINGMFRYSLIFSLHSKQSYKVASFFLHSYRVCHGFDLWREVNVLVNFDHFWSNHRFFFEAARTDQTRSKFNQVELVQICETLCRMMNEIERTAQQVSYSSTFYEQLLGSLNVDEIDPRFHNQDFLVLR